MWAGLPTRPFLTLFKKVILVYSRQLKNLIGPRDTNFPLMPHGGFASPLQEPLPTSPALFAYLSIWWKQFLSTSRRTAGFLRICEGSRLLKKLPRKWVFRWRKYT